MSLNEALQEQYEVFEGDVRKLDELISQLELWSDECTINHKKEEVRLPQYVELHFNLEALKEELTKQMNALAQEEALKEKVVGQREHIQMQLERYKPTEEVIHDWIRDIKNIYGLIHQSPILEENKEYIMAIIE